MSRNIAIIGAGPIGLETGLYAARNGWNVDLYERERVGAHIRKWAHVDFFSPWRLNRSPWGETLLRQEGHELADPDEAPSGEAYLRQYLEPLARHPRIAPDVHVGVRVDGVARDGVLKDERIGDPSRGDAPFVLRLETPDGPEYARADVVVDATGVYDRPRGLGPGGVPALGEAEHRDQITYWIPDPTGDDRDTYEGATTLVVGGGYSAATSLRHLHELAESSAGTRVVWLRRGETAPYTLIDDDPLPGRRALGEWGNRVAADEVPGIDVVSGGVQAIRGTSDGALEVDVDRQGTSAGCDATLRVDRVVANIGYLPDLDLTRELQIHRCYATEGPMDLAGSLLSQDSADCLDQSAGGLELLESPEPDFFALGAKSYGRNSDFILDVGYDQIRQVIDSYG